MPHACDGGVTTTNSRVGSVSIRWRLLQTIPTGQNRVLKDTSGSLGDFKDPEQSECPQAGEADGSLLEYLDENELEERAGDDHGVELVEGRLEVDPGGEGEHPGQHLDDERRQEGELAVI